MDVTLLYFDMSDRKRFSGVSSIADACAGVGQLVDSQLPVL